MSSPRYTAADIEKGLNIKLTEQQKNYFNNSNIRKYVLPAMNRQISTLLTKLNNPANYFKLCQLICKFSYSWDFADVIHTLLRNKHATDIDIFEKLFGTIKNIPTVRDYSKKHIADYLVNILNTIDPPFNPKSYLDIGCGTAILTLDLGRALNIPTQNIIGADVPDEFEENWKNARPKEIKYYTILDDKLEIGRTFDLITCMMVLHHVDPNTLQNYIHSIYNLLNPQGIFMIKEHDCFNAADYIMADLEHSMYIVQEGFAASGARKINPTIKSKIFNQVINYKDRFSWKLLICRSGFECIYDAPYDTRITNTYAPNRAYLAIFKKLNK